MTIETTGITDRQAIRLLEKMVVHYMESHNLTQEIFCERSHGLLNRNKLQPFLCGERRSVSLTVVAGIATAMELPFSVVIGRMGLMWYPNRAPFTSIIESVLTHLDQLWLALPDEGRDEFSGEILRLTDEFFKKYKIAPKQG